MAWDWQIDHATGDMTGRIVTGQDEIVQRVTTRLWRHLGEWFCNTSAGMPWYSGSSKIISGQLSPTEAILGSKDRAEAGTIIRNEIAETTGVLDIVNFEANFDNNTREFAVSAEITTEYGLAYVSVNRVVNAA